MKDKDWIENYCSGRVENYFERTHCDIVFKWDVEMEHILDMLKNCKHMKIDEGGENK